MIKLFSVQNLSILIERIGYPIVVSAALFYLVFIGLEKTTAKMERINESITNLSAKLDTQHEKVSRLIYRRNRRDDVSVVSSSYGTDVGR